MYSFSFHRSDLCFYVIKDGKVVSLDRALDEFDLRERRSEELREAYDEYNVDRVDVCFGIILDFVLLLFIWCYFLSQSR